MKISMRIGLLVTMAALANSLSSQGIKSLEFKNQEIRDILFVLGELNSVSIIPDDTVTGKSSFIFSNMEFDVALKLFLDSNGLFGIEKGGIYYISKVKIEYQADSGKLSVKGTDIPIKALISAVSNATAKTILYDQLPQDTISLQAESMTLKDFLSIVIAKYSEYYIDTTSTYFYIRRRTAPGNVDARPASGFFNVTGNLFSISLQRAKFRDLVLDLCAKAGKEVVFLMDQNAVLEDLNYANKSFEEMLRLLLLRVSGDFSVSEGVYFVVESQKRDLQNKLLTTLIIPLQRISFQDFQRLLPPSLNSSGKLKLDEKDNRVVLNGSVEELRPILDFIALVDVDKVNETTIRVDLSFLRSDEFIPLLPSEFSAFSPVGLPSRTGFLINLPPAKAQRLRDFVALADRQDQGVPINLKYIKSDELMANLPPSVMDQNIKKTPSSTLVFFRGSESQRRNFLRDLSAIDKPKPQIKYQLLILEIEDSMDTEWGAGLTASPINTRTAPGLTFASGSFSGLLGLSFDVLSTFGLGFGVDLNLQLSNEKARVVADTTLQALSGEKITFKNTRTMRIPITTVSSSSSTSTTTTDLREVTSGLILNIEGSASGARMVTLKIDSTLSKNLGATSDKTSIATTTEKVVTTTVRTEVGAPVAITGLKEEQVIQKIGKIPLLGDIPLIGLLFTKVSDNPVRTQYLIYIVPFIEDPEQNRDQVERGLVEQYYQYLYGQGNMVLP